MLLKILLLTSIGTGSGLKWEELFISCENTTDLFKGNIYIYFC